MGRRTVYRRFPDRTVLIDALFEQRIEELVAIAQRHLEDPDPWAALRGFLGSVLELQAGDRGLKELLLGSPGASERLARARAQVFPVASALVARARATGMLREDVEPEDLPLLQLMIGTVIDCARDVEPDLWRRYLEIILQGLRADGAPIEPLTTRALDRERLPVVLGAWQPPRR